MHWCDESPASSKEELTWRVEELFDFLYANGTSTCTMQEFVNGVVGSPPSPSIWAEFSAADASTLYKEIDADRDGRISKKDYEDYVSLCPLLVKLQSSYMSDLLSRKCSQSRIILSPNL